MRGTLAPCGKSLFSSSNSFIDVMFICFIDFNYNFFGSWIMERKFLATVTVDEFTVDEKSSFNVILFGHILESTIGWRWMSGEMDWIYKWEKTVIIIEGLAERERLM